MTAGRVLAVAVAAAACSGRSPDAPPVPEARHAPPLDAAIAIDAAPVIDRQAAADAVLAAGCGGSPIAIATADDGTVASCERSDAPSGEATSLRVVRARDGRVRRVAVDLRGPSRRTPRRINAAIDLVAPLLDEPQRDAGWSLLAQASRAPQEAVPLVEAGGVWLAAGRGIDDQAAPWRQAVILEIGFDGPPVAAPSGPDGPATIGDVGPSNEVLLEAICRDDVAMERLLGQPVSAAFDDDDWVSEPDGRWSAEGVWLRCVVRMSRGRRLTLTATLGRREGGLHRLAIELDRGTRAVLAAVLDDLGGLLLPDAVRAEAVAAVRGRPADAVDGVRIEVAHPAGGQRVTITAAR